MGEKWARLIRRPGQTTAASIMPCRPFARAAIKSRAPRARRFSALPKLKPAHTNDTLHLLETTAAFVPQALANEPRQLKLWNDTLSTLIADMRSPYPRPVRLVGACSHSKIDSRVSQFASSVRVWNFWRSRPRYRPAGGAFYIRSSAISQSARAVGCSTAGARVLYD